MTERRAVTPLKAKENNINGSSESNGVAVKKLYRGLENGK